MFKKSSTCSKYFTWLGVPLQPSTGIGMVRISSLLRTLLCGDADFKMVLVTHLRNKQIC